MRRREMLRCSNENIQDGDMESVENEREREKEEGGREMLKKYSDCLTVYTHIICVGQYILHKTRFARTVTSSYDSDQTKQWRHRMGKQTYHSHKLVNDIQGTDLFFV